MPDFPGLDRNVGSVGGSAGERGVPPRTRGTSRGTAIPQRGRRGARGVVIFGARGAFPLMRPVRYGSATPARKVVPRALTCAVLSHSARYLGLDFGRPCRTRVWVSAVGSLAGAGTGPCSPHPVQSGRART